MTAVLPPRKTPGMATVPAATAMLPPPTYTALRLTERMLPLDCCKLPVCVS